MRRSLLASLCLLAPLHGPLHGADLLVDFMTPGAYRTLQAALDAAQPGDRILIGQADQTTLGVRTTIRKSVTIQALAATRIVLPVLLDSGTPMPRILVESLTPGLPLVLRALEIQASPTPTQGRGTLIATGSALAGEIRMEDVVVTWAGGGSQQLEYAITLANLEVTRLVLRKCRFSAADTAANGGCLDIPDTAGSSALRFTGTLLTLEDTELRAGSANFLRKINCGGVPEFATGGPGGTALVANSTFTFAVRTKLSDGNGGSVQTGAWTVTPSGGPAGLSVLTRTTGTLAAWALELEAGRPGAVVPTDPGPTRGAKSYLGELEAPLTFVGDAKLGQSTTLLLGPSLALPAGVLIGFRTGPLVTSLGAFLCDGTQPIVVVPLTTAGWVTFAIPNDPALTDLLVVGQLVATAPLRAGNPTTIALRR